MVFDALALSYSPGTDIDRLDDFQTGKLFVRMVNAILFFVWIAAWIHS